MSVFDARLGGRILLCAHCQKFKVSGVPAGEESVQMAPHRGKGPQA